MTILSWIGLILTILGALFSALGRKNEMTSTIEKAVTAHFEKM